MRYLIVTLSFLTGTIAFSQADSTTLEDSIAVRTVIDQLFEGMRTGDSTLVGNQFGSDVHMSTTFKTKSGEIKVIDGELAEFKNAVGTPHDELWDERISNVEIRIDDPLAQVWMDYSFFVDGNFSHCGVNAMQLIKQNDGWKIVYLIDTRRKSNCN